MLSAKGVNHAMDQFMERVEQLQEEIIKGRITINALVIANGGKITLTKANYAEGLKYMLNFEEDKKTEAMTITLVERKTSEQ